MFGKWEHWEHKWVIQVMTCPAWKAAGMQQALSLPFPGETLMSELPQTRTVPFFWDLKENFASLLTVFS